LDFAELDLARDVGGFSKSGADLFLSSSGSFRMHLGVVECDVPVFLDPFTDILGRARIRRAGDALQLFPSLVGKTRYELVDFGPARNGFPHELRRLDNAEAWSRKLKTRSPARSFSSPSSSSISHETSRRRSLLIMPRIVRNRATGSSAGKQAPILKVRREDGIGTPPTIGPPAA
jgi:hypothetical protein